MSRYQSHGSGKFKKADFKRIGQNVVFEPGVLVFHPENIEIGNNVYIGPGTVLEGYHQNKLVIGNNVWIGGQCFFHGAGGLEIGSNVGFGPGIKILTSVHDLAKDNLGPIINLPLKYAPVVIEAGGDIGTNATILPGVTIAEGTQVGAGAVVTKDTERFSIVAGIPAKKIGTRTSPFEAQKIEQVKPLKEIFIESLGHLIRYFFDLIFIVFLPLFIIYGWTRLAFKKILKQKPRILISPLALPLPLFAVRAIRTQGFKADNFALNCPAFFRKIAFGLILADHRLLRIGAFLTDYLIIFVWSLLRYDLFEFPFSGGILANSHLRKAEYFLLKLCAKKIAVYGYGSDCKILSEIRKQGFKYNNAMDRAEETESYSEKTISENLQRAQKYAGVLIAGGDLTHFGEKGIMLPLAADLSLWRPAKKPKSKDKKIVIIHSTNHRSHKGTRFILEIVAKLEKKLPIKLLLIEKKTIAECQKLYPQGDIFIPDVITGWHGFTAIEAMAIGKPVITYLRADIMKHHAYYAQGNIPAISANPDNLAQAITRLVKNPKLREKLGQRGRQYTLKFHSLEFVGCLRSILYEYIWKGKKINQRIFEKEVKKRKLIE